MFSCTVNKANHPISVMKPSLLLLAAYIFLCNCQQSNAQITLNWGSSYSPSWLNGILNRTASNIGGNSVSCTTDIVINGSGSFVQTGVTSGSQTPTVSGAVFTVPGSANRVHLTPNFGNNSSYINITYTFTSLVTNVSFRIADIDKNNSTSTTYYDRVTITGANNSGSVNPTITKYDATTDPNFLIISGNTAEVNTVSGQAGNTASDATDQRGTVNVSFGSASINSITIRYDNAPGADANPAAQAIAIGNLSFIQSTLPVTLTDFGGYRQQQDIQLNWKTRQEFNTDHFEVERNDGNNWEKIGTIAAAGFSSSTMNYSYRDISPQGNILLYRLRMVDIDGKYNYSNIVRITSNDAKKELSVYPNPFRSGFSTGIYADARQEVTIFVTDAAGKRIQAERRVLQSGYNNIFIQGVNSSARGTYYLQVYDATGKLSGTATLVKE